MAEAWTQFEGQVVNGQFHLRRFLGSGEASAVFLTERGEPEPHKAAIKLVAASPEKSEIQLSTWALAAKLSHPHLIRLFEAGRCRLDDADLLYVVMDPAEEDLSQILPQRPLTPEETREMLEPVLDALAYLHSQGFVHAHIKPANIMAVDDQLRISSDGLWPANEDRAGLERLTVYDAPEMATGKVSPAADLWSLATTLVEALTQRLPVWEQPDQEQPALPEIIPPPFLELVRHCLRRDPGSRWSLADIVAHLRESSRTAHNQEGAAPRAASHKRRYFVFATAVVALAAVLAGPRLLNFRRTAPPAPPEETKPQPAPPPAPAQSEAPPPAPAPRNAPGKVAHRVLPDVPRKSRDTIQGKVRVSVTVHVDPSGRVSGAKLDSAGPSRYFANLALQAARRWRFEPPIVDSQSVASQWILHFEFARSGTTVAALRAAH